MHILPRKRFLSAVFAAFSATSLTASADTADLVYLGGVIHTVDAQYPTAEALAVRDGKFIYVGNDDGAKEFIDESTEVVRLDGAFVMPALYDIHIHALTGQVTETYNCGFSPNSTVEEILGHVRHCAERSDDLWVQGGAFGVELVKTYEGPPIRALLDEVSGDKAVYLTDMSFHTVMLNSKALELLGITRDSQPVEGGFIYRDADGNPNGFIAEQQITAIQKMVPVRSEPELDSSMVALQRRMNGYGVVGWREAFPAPYELETYARGESSGKLHSRVSACMAFPFKDGGIDRVIETSAALSGVFFKIDCAKAFADGIMPSFTSFLVEPYSDPSVHGMGDDYRGYPFLTVEALADAMTDLDTAGMVLKTHGSADGAHRLILDAAAITRTRNGPDGPRHEGGHIVLVHPDDRHRYAELNVAAELSPAMWFPSELAKFTGERDLGYDRAHQQFPARAMIDAGAMVTAGSDWPVAEPNPWPAIEALITRQDPYRSTEHFGMPYLGKDQAINLQEALQIYTLNNADQMGHPDEWGSITVGKSADLLVLNHNLTEIDPKAISETYVLRTLLAGEVVHEMSEEEIVHQRSRSVAAAFRNKSVEQMRDLYADDVRVVTAGSPALEGREQVMGFFGDFFKSPADQLIMNVHKVEVDGNMAIEVGDYVLTLPDGSAMDKGNCLVHWRKSDGAWRVVNDVIVTNM